MYANEHLQPPRRLLKSSRLMKKASSFPMRAILKQLYQYPLIRRACWRFGPAVWRLPAVLRWRLQMKSQIAWLPGVRVWRFHKRESVRPSLAIPQPYPTFGHRIAARPFRAGPRFVAEMERAWLVGQHATPITPDGRILLTPFRDQPGMMALEPHPELEDFVKTQAWRRHHANPEWSCVCSFVNRLDSNYFHWLVEWCGQLEGLLHYADKTGAMPKILIRQGGASFQRASLELLGVKANAILEWNSIQEPRLVSKLIVSSIPGVRIASSPQNLTWLRARFLQCAGIAQDKVQPMRRIYIPRKRGGWRSVVNDEEVRTALQREGFDILSPEKLSLAEQIRLFSEIIPDCRHAWCRIDKRPFRSSIQRTRTHRFLWRRRVLQPMFRPETKLCQFNMLPARRGYPRRRSETAHNN